MLDAMLTLPVPLSVNAPSNTRFAPVAIFKSPLWLTVKVPLFPVVTGKSIAKFVTFKLIPPAPLVLTAPFKVVLPVAVRLILLAVIAAVCTSVALFIWRLPIALWLPTSPLNVILPVPAVRVRFWLLTVVLLTVLLKRILPVPAVPVSSKTLFCSVTGPLKVMFLSLVAIGPLSAIVPMLLVRVISPVPVVVILPAVMFWFAVSAIEALSVPVRLPVGKIAINPAPSGERIVTGSRNVRGDSMVITPMLSVRPIAIDLKPSCSCLNSPVISKESGRSPVCPSEMFKPGLKGWSTRSPVPEEGPVISISSEVMVRLLLPATNPLFKVILPVCKGLMEVGLWAVRETLFVDTLLRVTGFIKNMSPLVAVKSPETVTAPVAETVWVISAAVIAFVCTLLALLIVSLPTGVMLPTSPPNVILPVPAVRFKSWLLGVVPLTVLLKRMSPIPAPVLRLTLFATVTGLLKVILLLVVVTSAFKEVTPLNVIPPLAVIGPSTAIDPVPVGGWIVVAVFGSLNWAPLESIAIAPVPSVRPITICEKPLNVLRSAWSRFKLASLLIPPIVIPKLGVSGCKVIVLVPVPLTWVGTESWISSPVKVTLPPKAASITPSVRLTGMELLLAFPVRLILPVPVACTVTGVPLAKLMP